MRFISKKLVELILTLLVTSFFVFASFEFISGDPATSKLGIGATKEAVEELQEEMGLNRPFLVRYGSWVAHFAVGDLGESYAYSIPVTKLIMEKIPINVSMALMAMVFTVMISLPLGIFLAKHKDSVLDRIGLIINQICMAIPPFLVGLALTFLFGLVLHLFSPGKYVSYSDSFWGFLGYLICPSIALAIPKCAMSVKLLRSTILTESKKDYVRTAYSRGNDTNGILYKHVLKNSLMPTITFLGMLMADMIASGIVIEQVFSIPGLGRILLSAISSRDYPVIQAIVMLISTGVILLGFLVDIINKKIDPRVSQQLS